MKEMMEYLKEARLNAYISASKEELKNEIANMKSDMSVVKDRVWNMEDIISFPLNNNLLSYVSSDITSGYNFLSSKS